MNALAAELDKLRTLPLAVAAAVGTVVVGAVLGAALAAAAREAGVAVTVVDVVAQALLFLQAGIVLLGVAPFGHEQPGQLRTSLAAVPGRIRLAAAKTAAAALAQRVGDARDERRLRPDHDEVDVVVDGEVRDEDGVVRVQGDRLDVGGDAGVAGGGDDLVPRLLAEQALDDRVLAGTGAEDEDAHPVSLPRPPRASLSRLFRPSRPSRPACSISHGLQAPSPDQCALVPRQRCKRPSG